MNPFFRYAVWVCAGWLGGCAAPPSPAPDGDWIAIQQLSVPSPGVLTGGESLQVQVRYQLQSCDTAILQVRPFHAGVQVPGHLAHVPLVATAGTGEATSLVAFSTDAIVDEVRASLVTIPRYRILAEARRPADLRWRSNQ